MVRGIFVARRLILTSCLLASPGAQGQDPFAPSAPATGSPAQSAKGSEKTTVAMLTVKGSLPESAGQAGLFGDLEVHLADMVARLDRAATDKSLSAVVIKLRNPEIGPGKIRELREAVQRVRKSGKRVTAQLESASAPDYLIACACDEIVMPESGEIMIPGVRAELMYFKGLFDHVGIQPDFLQVGEFKGAAEPFTRTEMSPEFRKQYEAVLDDLFGQIVDMIATDRKLDPVKVRELIDVGLFLPHEAKSAGLIDDVAYDDQLKSRLETALKVEQVEFAENYGRKKVSTDFSGMAGMFELLNLMLGTKPIPSASSNQKLALIYASGMIMPGESLSGIFGDQVVGSDTLVKAIRQAANDKSVVAIVLRVDSPGGSAMASDQIWRAIQQCEKPIVASMGDVAASGGYYISMGCDKVFAEPGTITGSIGVVGGKLVLKGLYNKVGLTTDVISRGRNSGILSESSIFSESERASWTKMMEDVYKQFLRKAAAGRKLELTRLESLAGGRIWTGLQASRLGLVDEVGTLRDAIAAAKKLAGQDSEAKLELLVLPKPKSFLDQLVEGDVGITSPVGMRLGGLTGEPARRIAELDQWQRLFRERTLFLMPHRITLW